MSRIVYVMSLVICIWMLTQTGSIAQNQPDEDALEPERSARLPAAAEQIVQARNGDLLVVKLAGRNLVGIVDVAQRRLVRTIRTSSAEFMFAAGGNKVVVYDPAAMVFTTYNLEDGSRIKATRSPFTGVVVAMVMGSNNDDFALLRVAAGTGALDNVRYARLDLTTLNGRKYQEIPHNSSYRNAEHMRLSPDGTMFCAWATSHSPSGQIVGTVSATNISLLYEHSSVGHILPVPGKQMAVTGSGAVLSGSNRIITSHRGQVLFPDATGAFYVGVSGQRVNVFASGSHQMFNSLHIPLAADRFGRSATVVFPLSQHKVIATQSSSGDAIDFYTFDPIGNLKDSDLDYLIVLSSPPSTLEAGTTFEYTPEVVTNASSWSMDSLDLPEGAKVEGQKVTWDVPQEAVGEEFEFLLRISTSNDDEVFHTFKVKVIEKAESSEPEE